MNIFKVNTTAYEEEDFYLHTELSSEEVITAIEPLIIAEREGVSDYDNELLLDAIIKKYPRKKTELYMEFDLITI